MRTPVTKGTVRALVGLVAFPTSWITAAVITADGFLPVTLLVVTMAVGALAAIWMVERALALAGMLLRWQGQRERIGTVGLAEEVRERGRAHGARRGGLDVSASPEHVARSDCERIRHGLVGQPMNTVSSLAFVAAAFPIARRARASRSPAWSAVAAASALAGIGSVAYHGPGGRRSKAVHDAGIVALVATVTIARLTERPRQLRPRAAALAGGAFVLHALSRTGGPLCSCESRLQGHALFHVLASAALVASSPRP